MPRTLALVCALTLCGLSAAAHADDLEQAREHYRKGTVAYDLQHYQEAAQEYEAAFRLKDDPAILFNLGQAYRLAGEYEKAIGFYRAYLRRSPSATNKRDVSARIAEMQALVEGQKKAQAAPPAGTFPVLSGTQPQTHPETRPTTETAPTTATNTTAPTTTETQPTTAPATTQTQPAIVETAPPERHHRRGRTLKIAGIAVGGAGAILLIGGIAAAVLAQSASDSVAQASQQHRPYDPGAYSTWQTDQAAAIALIALGGVAVVGGVVMLAIGVKRSHAVEQPPAFSFVPQLAPGYAGAAAEWRF